MEAVRAGFCGIRYNLRITAKKIGLGGAEEAGSYCAEFSVSAGPYSGFSGSKGTLKSILLSGVRAPSKKG